MTFLANILSYCNFRNVPPLYFSSKIIFQETNKSIFYNVVLELKEKTHPNNNRIVQNLTSSFTETKLYLNHKKQKFNRELKSYYKKYIPCGKVFLYVF